MWNQSRTNIYVAGHRGYPEKYPENTLVSFQAAINVQVDMLELDIQMTQDGELILMHDSTVDRTTDGTGSIREKSLAEIRQLDAGIRFNSQFQGTRVPTFREFLEMVRDNQEMLYNFEIKEYPRNGNEQRAYAATDKMIALIEEYGCGERCVINIFDATLLEYILDQYQGKYKLHGYYPESYLHRTAENRDPYTYLYCACPFVKGGEAYDYLRSRGVQPWAGASVKDLATIQEVVGYGAPLITCNNPGTVLQILRELNLHK